MRFDRILLEWTHTCQEPNNYTYPNPLVAMAISGPPLGPWPPAILRCGGSLIQDQSTAHLELGLGIVGVKQQGSKILCLFWEGQGDAPGDRYLFLSVADGHTALAALAVLRGSKGKASQRFSLKDLAWKFIKIAWL